MMIDDNPQSQKYVERILRHRSSHDIGFSASAAEAIEKLVERRPDLILLDLFIPGMDGFELFKTLRDHPATADIPIVIHSAVPLDQLTQMRLKRVRTDGYLEFPIEASELNRTIANALQRHSGYAKVGAPQHLTCTLTHRARHRSILLFLTRRTAIEQTRNPHRHRVRDDHDLTLGELAFVDEDVERLTGEFVQIDHIIFLQSHKITHGFFSAPQFDDDLDGHIVEAAMSPLALVADGSSSCPNWTGTISSSPCTTSLSSCSAGPGAPGSASLPSSGKSGVPDV